VTMKKIESHLGNLRVLKAPQAALGSAMTEFYVSEYSMVDKAQTMAPSTRIRLYAARTLSLLKTSED